LSAAGFGGATGESRCYPDMIFCSAAAAAENRFTRAMAPAPHRGIAIQERRKGVFRSGE